MLETGSKVLVCYIPLLQLSIEFCYSMTLKYI